MPKKIIWVDDEIDALRPLVLSLENDGYEVTTLTNGLDAINVFKSDYFDLVLLDENMPGMNGFDTLLEMKKITDSVPMVMITKSERQDTMENAWANQVADFLVKPVSIAQLRAMMTKIFRKRELEEARIVEQFRQDYNNISQKIGFCKSFADWVNLYSEIVSWEVKLPEGDLDMLRLLKKDANTAFGKFVKANYLSWFTDKKDEAPLFSHRILSEVIKPELKAGGKIAFVVIDNFRLDQWRVIRPILEQDFRVKSDICCSILPTSTQFSRNAIFSGLLPADIIKLHPEFWMSDVDGESVNQFERELLADYFKRQRLDVENSYYKVGSNDSGEDYIRGFSGSKNHRGYANNQLNALVFSFVDALSHACTDNRTISELIPDDKAYRKITRQWFADGVMIRILRLLGEKGFKIILTTDHGAIRVDHPVDIAGPSGLNRNLRFKVGKNLNYNSKEVFEVANSREIDFVGLPKTSVADRYVFALNDDYFVYKNNRNEYVERYADSFQHGGVSMEEMILPLVTLEAK